MAIHLLGTNHISRSSAQKVRSEVATGTYQFIAVELDRVRAKQLLSGKKQKASFVHVTRQVGFAGAMFAFIGQWIQRYLGGKLHIVPGEEMKTALLAAKDHQLPAVLIDRNIRTTLKRFTKAFTFREFLRIVGSMFSRRKVQLDVSTVPTEKVVVQLIAELERVSPALTNVLIHERNEYMVKRLIALQAKFPESNILAVVGAGHVPGMKECLNKHNKQVEHASRA